MTWTFARGCWVAGPFTVRLEVCPRMKLTYFEVFNHTCFVRSFASLQEAQEHARSMSYRVAV